MRLRSPSCTACGYGVGPVQADTGSLDTSAHSEDSKPTAPSPRRRVASKDTAALAARGTAAAVTSAAMVPGADTGAVRCQLLALSRDVYCER